MDNPYLNYYVNQAGSGISGFQGQRFQRGHGFFGRLFSGTILPVLKFLGKHALAAGVNIGQDALQGEPLKESVKKRLRETGADVAQDTWNRIKEYAQTGKGRKRKRSKSKTAAKRQKPKKAIKKKKVYKNKKKINRTSIF